jgi:pantoate--beta-alanine ligase
MVYITEVSVMQQHARAWHRDGQVIGLVPTMGYLHEGHLSLVRLARENCDQVVVSIFVNPSQFGPGEDFATYPRDLARDEVLCREHGVDVIFAPAADELYAGDFSTWVTEESLSQGLCGKSRPGHFRGVTTVVCKLLNTVMPDIAVFGQKDAQQAAIIKRMVRDLDFDVRILTGPIIREPDGLAMSSRNVRLSPEERQRATAINRGLNKAGERLAGGETESAQLRQIVLAELSAVSADVDYVVLVAEADLRPLMVVDQPAILAVAARFGQTRLIDNCLLKPHNETHNL